MNNLSLFDRFVNIVQKHLRNHRATQRICSDVRARPQWVTLVMCGWTRLRYMSESEMTG